MIKPKKQLGQHYLTDTLVIEQILKAINPKSVGSFKFVLGQVLVRAIREPFLALGRYAIEPCRGAECVLCPKFLHFN